MSAADVRLAFKAGRATRREGSNIVESRPEKGAIVLSSGDDGLLHFMWKNRSTNEVEEDLILFPSDASFTKVAQAASGRVYVLAFSSSNQKHFFWMQDASPARDEEFVNNVNALLEDPDHPLTFPSVSQVAGTSTSPPGQPASNESHLTEEQVAELTSLLTSNAARTLPPEISLSDILTPANLGPLFVNHPELIPALFPHLPPDLPIRPTTEVLQQIINSPQFRAAVSNFDQALRTGLLGGLVRNLGLPEEAGTGIIPFLRAIQEQADREREQSRDERMETD